MPLPPDMHPCDKIALFDADCPLGRDWSRFLRHQDHLRRVKLHSVQSAEGRAILDWFGLPGDCVRSLLYIDDRQGYERSDALLQALGQLTSPWRWLRVLRVLPESLRDSCLDRVVYRRYRLFASKLAPTVSP
ncbi:thiol-disulfide oxidoreductase DCC family protein [Pseudomonas sp. BGr12]|uniref:thiol-disulfide oxidoreductase DCC family protein n=1 Tax=unclassified Pseudomonas TaxID=196821 RepID=UPI00177B58F4|nr:MULTISPECIES: DCC1-like thiol-disulfide oxidoreductase family protein [unclassified Pseudomonas]MBD9503258.1 DUF393 domain-containing protein [Pseudomonas sp. PDM17]MBD9574269.1 DUF393 domain-containing protein [Pseudomonas sp. PDM23]MBD9672107.1 DUF393 domain-containing protein [Pseudomonas sp. PDM21]MDL2425728.1 DCC1-like thiol-disulfide oxidoreductase family protein [Pseudomonas sp. BJa5]